MALGAGSQHSLMQAVVRSTPVSSQKVHTSGETLTWKCLLRRPFPFLPMCCLTYLLQCAVVGHEPVWLSHAPCHFFLSHEAELYGYYRGLEVDLGPMMPVTQFWVAEEGGAYLCVVRGLVFKRSVLAYNPAMNEVEWIPVRGLANDLT